MVRKAALIALIVATIPTAALADWQFTHWGMTADEVRAASPNPTSDFNFTDFNAPGSIARLRMGYAARGRAFGVAFRFGDEGLNGIVVRPNEQGQCRDILSEMVDAYGEPIENNAARFTHNVMWRAESDGNVVTYYSVIDGPVTVSCFLEYRPIRAGRDLGY